MIDDNSLPLFTRRLEARLHIGPPIGLSIPTSSGLFQTRCGLGLEDGPWVIPSLAIVQLGEMCGACLAQAGLVAGDVTGVSVETFESS